MAPGLTGAGAAALWGWGCHCPVTVGGIWAAPGLENTLLPEGDASPGAAVSKQRS